MTSKYGSSSVNNQLYLKSIDILGQIYGGASSDSPIAAPLCSNGSDSTYSEQVSAAVLRNVYPVQDPVIASSMGLIPVEFDLKGLYETQDRRKKKRTDDKVDPPHVQPRRRAQNRASQRAFRDRKEKQMKEAKEKLIDLQGQYTELSRAYETLKVEHTAMKEELEALQIKHKSASPEPRYTTSRIKEWEECRAETPDPLLLFDFSAFFYDREEDYGQKGTRG